MKGYFKNKFEGIVMSISIHSNIITTRKYKEFR